MPHILVITAGNWRLQPPRALQGYLVTVVQVAALPVPHWLQDHLPGPVTKELRRILLNVLGAGDLSLNEARNNSLKLQKPRVLPDVLSSEIGFREFSGQITLISSIQLFRRKISRLGEVVQHRFTCIVVMVLLEVLGHGLPHHLQLLVSHLLIFIISEGFQDNLGNIGRELVADLQKLVKPPV